MKSIGLMTGSSMDGIDAALLETDGEYQVRSVAGASISFGPEFKILLRACEYALVQENGDLILAEKHFRQHLQSYVFNEALEKEFKATQTFSEIIHQLTLLHVDVVQQLLKKTGLNASQIDVIGFHGQNLYHHPEQKITIQVGDAQLLANKTQIQVIHRFRENDVQQGGRGAPFAPLYHQVLSIGQSVFPLAVVNCGGISNVTFILGPEPEQLIGFDVGPGNVLIDRYVRERTQNREWMDRDGSYGKRGVIHQEVFELLKEHSIVSPGGNFFTQKPPKSLDTRHFKWVEALDKLSIEDACATLEAFTAWGIVAALEVVSIKPPKHWILVGGGWNNPVITQYLREFLKNKVGEDVQVMHSEEWGWSSQWMEAEMFAYFAVRSLKGLPLSFPNTTGVPAPTAGGMKCVPQK